MRVGDDVSRFRAGDEVYGVFSAFGAFSEYAAISAAAALALKPRTTDFVHAAALARCHVSCHEAQSRNKKNGRKE
jgi:NADPH:quinone reductase-like Zn-dependent oxidoreductase